MMPSAATLHGSVARPCLMRKGRIAVFRPARDLSVRSISQNG